MSAKIHFYLRLERPSKDGSVPIYLMMSLSRDQRVKISLEKYIPIKKEYSKVSNSELLKLSFEERSQAYFWDLDKERASKGFANWESLNMFLDNEKYRANQIILKYEQLNKPITVDLFKQAFLKPNATDVFSDYFLAELEKRKPQLAEGTYRGIKGQISKINKFKPTLTLGGIDYKFLTLLESHMLKPVSEKGLGNQQCTVARTMKVLRALIQIAIKNGDFPKDAYPFKDYRIKHVDPVLTTRDYLEPEDLYKVEQLLSAEKICELTIGEIKAVKRFLFSCYTGLRFSDVNNLKRKHHIFGKWIQNPQLKEMVFKYYIEIRMGKTDQPVFIPLIDRALELINETQEDQVFEIISNQKVNEHLKSINKKAKLNKKLSFHVARHSFATICFLHGIPENVGQKLLGHKNRKFTEVYTHLSKNKLFYEMDKFSRGLSSFELLSEEMDVKRNDMKELMPMLQNLNQSELDQIKGLVKLLGGGKAA
ncbi:MAG: site-specific integrase [Bacteroidetes bacterium]|nr:site-specific integrase [Bacteroidota bacterium]